MGRIKFIIVGIFIFWGIEGLWANNVRIVGDVRVTPSAIVNNIAPIEFTVEWENSWCDPFNYDGVYIFLKYKLDDKGQEWHHVPLRDSVGVTTLVAGDAYGSRLLSSTGNHQKNEGVLIHRTRTGFGNSAVKVRLHWDITAGAVSLTTPNFNDGKVFLSAMAIEMVYVPQGAFVAGDSYSKNTFCQKYGSIPESYDIVSEEYGIVTKDGGKATNPPSFAANRMDDTDTPLSNAWLGTDEPGQYWQIDFGTKNGIPTGETKTVRYIAIEGVEGYVPDEWILYGINDLGAAGSKVELYKGRGSDWALSKERTYPATKRIKINNNEPYRYYEINFSKLGSTKGPAIKTIAMAEANLDELTDKAVLLTGPVTHFSDAPGYPIDYLYSEDGDMNSGSLPAQYPNGYYGFWSMKYELSQEQYVAFLNKLTLAQQSSRTIGAGLRQLKPGNYIFGDDPETPSKRNGIVLASKGALASDPYVFANNLNTESDLSQDGDGQTLACNYLTPADLLAYASWSGLRPLSELEYEKLSRDPYPYNPKRREYAWGTTEFRKPEGIQVGTEGTRMESVVGDGNANAGGVIEGPLRVGAFAKGRADRQASGAGFWSAMDLVGNLAEIYYNANTEGRQFSGIPAASHGNGTLDTDGNSAVGTVAWPRTPAAFGLRGGSFATTDARLLATSDRSEARGSYTDIAERRSDAGLRLGCSMVRTTVESVLTLENDARTSLAVKAYDTICSGGYELIRGDFPSEIGGAHTIAWFCSRNKGRTWELVENSNTQDLLVKNLRNINNDDNFIKEYWYKRKIFSNGADAESGIAVICVNRPVYEINKLSDTLRIFDDAWGIEVSSLLPAKFEWWNVKADKELTPESGTNKRSFYRACHADFAEEEGGRATGSYPVDLVITYSDRCRITERLEVYAQKELDFVEHCCIVLHTKGYRLWADGKYAASVEEYRSPKVSRYSYCGDTGDGVYRIQPADAQWTSKVVDVYARMSNYGGVGQPVVQLGSTSGTHLWGDGTPALTMQDYLTPGEGYVYEGCTGPGVYKIRPEGSCFPSPMDVYYNGALGNQDGQPIVRRNNSSGYRILGNGQSMNPFPAASQTFTYVSSERYAVSCAWDAAQPRTWSLSGAASGVTIDPTSGIISGGAAICSDMIVTISCNECPDVKYTKAVQVVPPAAFSSSVQTITYNNNNTVQVATNWPSSLPQQWTITSSVKGGLSVSQTGVVSGLNTTMCNITLKVESTGCPEKYSGTVRVKEGGRYFYYIGTNYQTINLLPGSYRMECWGARGGGACQDWTQTSNGGLGGYASGVLALGSARNFYLYVGGNGGGLGAAGGWNGGGHGGANSDGEPGGSGGGASDIRITAGAWNNATSLNTRIMIAGGGGGAGNYVNGPAGGGLAGGSGANAAGGTQTTGYALGYGGGGGSDANYESGGGGGGGGLYGGFGAGRSKGAGGGGSGYISGHSGCTKRSDYSFTSTSMLNGQRNDHGLIKITVQ